MFLRIHGDHISRIEAEADLQNAESIPLNKLARPVLEPMERMKPMEPMKPMRSMRPMEMRMGNMEMRMGGHEEERPERKFCTKCGKSLNAEDRYCASCGSKV
ncbi:MAG: hypothetical protein QOD99_3170 [Chthoniobacter sp.]|jgi:hypothetical protein|nr:hypothetical protein [Chthoniobacter sp.]